MGIPARFVAGYAYALEPPDFHAYFEAYLNGRWYIFDSTRLAPQTGLIRIGTGRDAADTSFATFFGLVKFLSMKVTTGTDRRPGAELYHRRDFDVLIEKDPKSAQRGR